MPRFRTTLVIIASVTVLTIGALQWVKWSHYGYNGLDLGIYTQTVWSLSQGHGFANSIHDPSYLGDHLELILVPLAAVYRLFPFPLVLLWLQTIAIGLAGICIGYLARRYLSDRWALVATALFLTHPFVYNAAMYEFHGLTFALPLICAGIIFHERRSWVPWILVMAGLCLIREDLPFLVIGWAALAAWDRAPWRWWVGAAVFACFWYWASHAIILNANALHVYKYTAFIGWFGQTPAQMARFVIQQPLNFLAHIFAPNNWGVALGFLAGFGFLPLLRPRRLLPVSLSFAQLLLLGSSPNSVLRLHYVIPFLPFLAWASFTALRDARQGHVAPKIDQDLVRVLVGVVAIVGPLYLQFIYGPAEMPWRRLAHAETTAPASLTKAIASIQPTDRLLTTFNLLPVLGNRPAIYSLNYVYLGRRQYSETRYDVPGPIDVAVIDWKQLYEYQVIYRDTLFDGRTGEQRIIDLLAANHLVPDEWYGSVVVYRRSGRLATIDLARRVASSRPNPPALTPGQGSARSLADQIEISIPWSVGNVPSGPISLALTLTGSDGKKVAVTRILGESAVPASTWAVGDERITTHRVWLPPGFVTKKIDYTWFTLEGAYKVDRLRTFRVRVSSTTALGRGSIPASAISTQ